MHITWVTRKCDEYTINRYILSRVSQWWGNCFAKKKKRKKNKSTYKITVLYYENWRFQTYISIYVCVCARLCVYIHCTRVWSAREHDRRRPAALLLHRKRGPLLLLKHLTHSLSLCAYISTYINAIFSSGTRSAHLRLSSYTKEDSASTMSADGIVGAIAISLFGNIT